MERKNVDMSKVTPMMKQYLEIKDANPDIIIFFRLGDFYEMFFEDAILVSRELELTLTGKNAGLDQKIPMCGVPHHAANIYIEKLINRGYRIGICEQMEAAGTTKGIVRRDITQIVSVGTVFNQESLDEKDFNYIGAIYDFGHAYSLTYTDLTTGVIYTELVEHKAAKIVAEVISVGIKELIVNEKIDQEIIDIFRNQFKLTVTITNEVKDINIYHDLYVDLSDVRYIESVKFLLTYITETQKRSLTHLQKVKIKENKQYLKMDIHTKRNLELTETIRLKERTYSLIWLLDRTKTAMGSRLLKYYIENPLIDINMINERYEMVSKLIKEFILRGELQRFLDAVYDLERLSGRIAFGNANARDLLQLKSSLGVLPDINNILKKLEFHDSLENISNLYNLIEKAIYENPPVSIKEGYLIKEGYNSELDELKELRKGGKDFVARFENEEKERTGIKNLKIGYNRVFGYYIEISKGNISSIKDEYGYERRQTLSNCERYISPILKEKEALILNAEERIVELEYNLFNEIREEVKMFIPKLQQIARVISEIDVLQSFAVVAEENNYVRPVLNNNNSIKIINNRHPIIEKVIKDEFVPNDIIMSDGTDILLITGPNMAGKSTYMRQMAITAIMAQIGSYVAASSAKMPVFDAIYTRIGASDDLVSGESTFMVEMRDANNAISNATINSLILFDELGRGTATFDGMALAQAIIEHIGEDIKAKTLFSTHYHELTDLEKKMSNLKNVHVSALEENDNITFLHKVKEGSVDKSYGIHVARLANLPDSLIKRAKHILKVYEGNEAKREKLISNDFVEEKVEVQSSEIENELKNINPLEVTPLEALNILYNLKEKVNK